MLSRSSERIRERTAETVYLDMVDNSGTNPQDDCVQKKNIAEI